MNSLLTNVLIVVLIMDLIKYIKSEVKSEKIESLKWLIFALITGNALLFVYVNEILKKYTMKGKTNGLQRLSVC